MMSSDKVAEIMYRQHPEEVMTKVENVRDGFIKIKNLEQCRCPLCLAALKILEGVDV